MRLTFEDTKLIRDFEGHSLKAYPDPATGGEPYTIGYGCTGPTITKDSTITESEAIELFQHHIDELCTQLDKILKVELSKNQYLAVLSLVYNIGIGSFRRSILLKLLNKEDYNAAAAEFTKWCKAAGKQHNGLLKRRSKERELFLSAQ